MAKSVNTSPKRLRPISQAACDAQDALEALLEKKPEWSYEHVSHGTLIRLKSDPQCCCFVNITPAKAYITYSSGARGYYEYPLKESILRAVRRGITEETKLIAAQSEVLESERKEAAFIDDNVSLLRKMRTRKMFPRCDADTETISGTLKLTPKQWGKVFRIIDKPT